MNTIKYVQSYARTLISPIILVQGQITHETVGDTEHDRVHFQLHPSQETLDLSDAEVDHEITQIFAEVHFLSVVQTPNTL